MPEKGHQSESEDKETYRLRLGVKKGTAQKLLAKRKDVLQGSAPFPSHACHLFTSTPAQYQKCYTEPDSCTHLVEPLLLVRTDFSLF